jgi:hypothetical protein
MVRAWVLLAAGAALVAGVMTWRLAGTSLRADLGTICEAESRSGWTLRHEMPALTEWIRGHVTTSEGNATFSGLGDLPMAERAGRLRAAAARSGVDPCPLAASYEALVAEGDERGDLQRLCSYLTFPDLAAADDAARLESLEAWIEHDAANARTRALAVPLRDAQTPADRALVLRAAASAVGMLRCDIAGTIEKPQASAEAGVTDAARD